MGLLGGESQNGCAEITCLVVLLHSLSLMTTSFAEVGCTCTVVRMSVNNEYVTSIVVQKFEIYVVYAIKRQLSKPKEKKKRKE